MEKTIIASNVLITLMVIIINGKTPIKRPIAKTRRHCKNGVIVKRLLQMLTSTVHFLFEYSIILSKNVKITLLFFFIDFIDAEIILNFAHNQNGV